MPITLLFPHSKVAHYQVGATVNSRHLRKISRPSEALRDIRRSLRGRRDGEKCGRRRKPQQRQGMTSTRGTRRCPARDSVCPRRARLETGSRRRCLESSCAILVRRDVGCASHAANRFDHIGHRGTQRKLGHIGNRSVVPTGLIGALRRTGGAPVPT
jgi:hypothetical protein